MHKLIIILCLPIIIISCVQDPIQIGSQEVSFEKPYALIINEGLFGYNNSSLTYFSIATGKVVNDIFLQNNGYNLGDVANDAIVIDSNLYIVVSTSRILYEISLNNLKVKRILKFNQNAYPRQIAHKSNCLYVSDAYQNYIYKINLNLFQITDSVIVGAQPEGLGIIENDLYVVNSGWGDINANHPEASTLYKIDISTFKIKAKTKTFLNPVEIVVDTLNKQLIVTCYNLPSFKDSTGTIAFYDINLNLKKYIQGNFSKTKILKNQNLLSLLDNNPAQGKNSKPSLVLIDFQKNEIITILNNDYNKEFWYNFYYDQETQQIWVCNAFDFQSRGKVQIYNTNINFSKIELIKIFDVGLNPNQIILVK